MAIKVPGVQLVEETQAIQVNKYKKKNKAAALKYNSKKNKVDKVNKKKNKAVALK